MDSCSLELDWMWKLEGEIISVDYDTKLNGAYAIDVLFHEDGAVKKLMTSDINTKSVNGSPIGYWTEEAYYVG